MVFSVVSARCSFSSTTVGVVMSAQAWLSGSLLGTDWAQVRIALPFTIVALGLASRQGR